VGMKNTNKLKYNISNNKLYYNNNKFIGEIIKDVDGFYVYFPDKNNNGFFNENLLDLISNKLKELNKPIWFDDINNYFNTHKIP
jgi:hypothetical protein